MFRRRSRQEPSTESSDITELTPEITPSSEQSPEVQDSLKLISTNDLLIQIAQRYNISPAQAKARAALLLNYISERAIDGSYIVLINPDGTSHTVTGIHAPANASAESEPALDATQSMLLPIIDQQSIDT